VKSTTPFIKQLTSFFVDHEMSMGSFIPALYFFFEASPSASSRFLMRLREIVDKRTSDELRLFGDAFTPVKRGWFFGSKKNLNSITEEPVKEQISFTRTEAAAKMLPATFNMSFAFAAEREFSVRALSSSAYCALASFGEELDAYEGVAMALGEVFALFSVAPLLCSGDDVVDESDQLRDYVAVAKHFVVLTSILQKEVALPLWEAVDEEIERAACTAAGSLAMHSRMAKGVRIIIENEPMVIGGSYPKESPAATDSTVLLQARDLYGRKRLSLQLFAQHYDAEASLVQRTISQLLWKASQAFAAAVFEMGDVFNARHFAGFQGKEVGSAGHPIQSALKWGSTCVGEQ
jgi:hypothetical protein